MDVKALVLVRHDQHGAVSKRAQICEVEGVWVVRLREDHHDDHLDDDDAEVDERAEEKLEEVVEGLHRVFVLEPVGVGLRDPLPAHGQIEEDEPDQRGLWRHLAHASGQLIQLIHDKELAPGN